MQLYRPVWALGLAIVVIGVFGVISTVILGYYLIIKLADMAECIGLISYTGNMGAIYI